MGQVHMMSAQGGEGGSRKADGVKKSEQFAEVTYVNGPIPYYGEMGLDRNERASRFALPEPRGRGSGSKKGK